MIAFEAGLFGVGALLIMGPRIGGPAEHHGVMLAAASRHPLRRLQRRRQGADRHRRRRRRPRRPTRPWLLVAIAGSVTAFYASARSLQDGDAVAVIAITGTAANISCIAGGIIVFGDPMPGTTRSASSSRPLAFVLVIVATALTPAPGPRGRGHRRARPPRLAPPGQSVQPR